MGNLRLEFGGDSGDERPRSQHQPIRLRHARRYNGRTYFRGYGQSAAMEQKPQQHGRPEVFARSFDAPGSQGNRQQRAAHPVSWARHKLLSTTNFLLQRPQACRQIPALSPHISQKPCSLSVLVRIWWVHPPVFLFSHRLSDWPHCTLELRCMACRGRSTMPSIHLVMRRVGNPSFAELLPRLRCEQCRRPTCPGLSRRRPPSHLPRRPCCGVVCRAGAAPCPLTMFFVRSRKSLFFVPSPTSGQHVGRQTGQGLP